MNKKSLLIFMIIMIGFIFSMMNVSAEVIDSGMCGDNLTWTLDEEGVLIISGKGDMVEWSSPFENNQNIIKVKVEEGVTSLGWSAFGWCENITSIILPETLETISSYAFSWCTSLTRVKIPKNVDFIGGGIGAGSGSLLIDVDENNDSYCDIDGVLYNKDKTKIIAFAKADVQTTYTIPDTVTVIGEKAFANCYNLTKVTIPDSVSVIEREAFRNCNQLQNVKIPEKVTRLEEQIFYDCSSFTHFGVSKNVDYIGAGALSGCGNLIIKVAEDNPFYCAVDGVLFNKDKTELIIYSKGNLQSSYTVPEGITKIADLAFEWASNLERIVLPSTLETFGYMVFQGCDGLVDIVIPDGVEILPNGLFQSCFKLCSLSLPNSIKKIENYVFDECQNLTDVYYDGEEKDWNNIEIASNGNESLKNAKIHFPKRQKVNATVSADGRSFIINLEHIENGNMVLLALYKGDTFVKLYDAIYQGESIPFIVTEAYDSVKIMVWSDYESLTPLCNANSNPEFSN